MYFSVGFCVSVLCLFSGGSSTSSPGLFPGYEVGGFFVVFVSVFFSFCALVLAFYGFGRFRVFVYVFAPISTAGYRTAGALQYLVARDYLIVSCW